MMGEKVPEEEATTQRRGGREATWQVEEAAKDSEQGKGGQQDCRRA